MTEISTLDQVVKYIYNEATEYESSNLKVNSLINTELEEIIRQLSGLKSELNQLYLNPSQDTIDKILDYSRNYELLEKHTL